MTSRKTGFTIVELLTVMSIIIILMSILMPGLQRTRRYARVVVQKSQFNDITKGLELYRNDHSETYPDSSAADTNDPAVGYCGAMKLCEALLGQDGMGLNPASTFQATSNLYLFDLCRQITSTDVTTTYPVLSDNLRERTKYLDSDSVKAARLKDLYSWDTSTVTSYYAYGTAAPAKVSFKATVEVATPNPTQYPNSVITDVFVRMNSRCATITNNKKLGMPVLYYKADTSKLVHDASFDPSLGTYATMTTNPSIYNFDDNYALTGLGCPWETGATPTTMHPMYGAAGVKTFYKAITNTKVTSTPRPHNEDTYILVSAGWDGLYGTADDVYNFSD